MRIAKIIIGLLLVGYGVYSGNYWFFLGVIPLVTGVFNICCMKKLLGTCSGDNCSTADTQSCCSETSTACCSSDEEKTQEQKVPAETTVKKEGETEILILGTGCPKCIALQKVVEEVVASLEGDFKVKKVDDIEKIMSYGVMSTPGLVINGEVRSVGKVLNTDELRRLLETQEVIEEKPATACCSSQKSAS